MGGEYLLALTKSLRNLQAQELSSWENKFMGLLFAIEKMLISSIWIS